MPSFTQFLTAAALVAVSAAAPTKQGFTVEQVPKNTGKLTAGQHLVHRTYKKFGKTPPSHVVAAAAASTGSVTASPEEYDSEYLAPVTVGGSTVNLDFDTGSSDLWVFSSKLPSSERSGHSIYTPGSSSQLLSGYSWDISYGDGSGASGTVYKDTVTIGGATVTGQAVEAATSISAEFTQDTDTDGLVGLAFSSINTVEPQPQKTFFDNVKASLPSPILAANLKKGAAGTYDFGFLDSSKYTGAISYSAVSTRQGFWEITGSGYAVGSGSFTSSSIDGIVDTGTTLIYVPQAVLTAYYRQVSGAQNSNTYGGYVFPCSATLPSLTLGFGSYRATVPGSYINYAPVEDGSSTCFGGLQSSNGIGINIFGDIFIKSQYVVFDNSATPRLGLAAKA